MGVASLVVLVEVAWSVVQEGARREVAGVSVSHEKTWTWKLCVQVVQLYQS